MKCPNCGAPLSGDETFCPQCMARLPAQMVEVAPDARAPREKRWRWLRRHPLLASLLVVVALGLAVGIVVLLPPSRSADPLMEARRLYALHRDAEAIAALERAIAQGLGTGDAYLLLGRAHLRLGQYSEAADPFAHALARDSGLAGAYLGLGQATFHLGWEEMAEDNLAEAVARMPRSGTAHAYLGALYYTQGRLTDAQAHLEEALQLDAGDAWARAYLGRTYVQLGDAEAAIPELEQALQANPDDVEARLALAQAYATAGQYGQAAVDFQRVLRNRPADLEATLGYSEALLALDQPDEAQAALEGALNDAGMAARARRAALVAGWLQYGNDHYAEASNWFAAAIAFDPQSAAAHNGLGWVALQMGDCDAARAAFEEALALQPEGWTGAQRPQDGLEACR